MYDATTNPTSKITITKQNQIDHQPKDFNETETNTPKVTVDETIIKTTENQETKYITKPTITNQNKIDQKPKDFNETETYTPKVTFDETIIKTTDDNETQYTTPYQRQIK
jgi:hypothetical protein